MSSKQKLPYCIYCDKYVYHRPKETCKQYTEEKEDNYMKRLQEIKEKERIENENKQRLAEEMKKFSTDYPYLSSYFQKKFEELENEIYRLKCN